MDVLLFVNSVFSKCFCTCGTIDTVYPFGTIGPAFSTEVALPQPNMDHSTEVCISQHWKTLNPNNSVVYRDFSPNFVGRWYLTYPVDPLTFDFPLTFRAFWEGSKFDPTLKNFYEGVRNRPKWLCHVMTPDGPSSSSDFGAGLRHSLGRVPQKRLSDPQNFSR
jgi:hypothetical protein